MNVSPQVELLIVLFVVSVVIWLLLLLYKSRLDQAGADVFRTTPERLTEGQKKLLQKVDRLSIPMWIFGILSILLAIAAVACWLYQGLMAGG